MNEIDIKYMRRCLELAEKGTGYVAPNPLVGAVIVKDGKIIGEGWHRKYGEPHAEVNALQNATESVEGATLYCNLEPCCHTNKKTPPCVPAVIGSGIKRVVIANTDPNPEVSGKGLAQLEAAGIETLSGVLEEEGYELIRFFFKYIREKIPYVTVKIAQTMDGRITEHTGSQTWITGKESSRYVHELRSRFDAVLVGANTVNTDNPKLNVRHVEGRDPYRIVLDGTLVSDPDAVIFNDELADKTFLLTSTEAPVEKLKIFSQKNITIRRIKGGKYLDIKDVLVRLGKDNISSLLVEGGAEIFGKFICGDYYDEIVVLQSPKFFGSGLAALNCKTDEEPEIKSVEKIGEDIKIIMRKCNN